jgi:hypothetical protein
MAKINSLGERSLDGMSMRVTYYGGADPRWRAGDCVQRHFKGTTWVVKAKRKRWEPIHGEPDVDENVVTYDLWRCGPTIAECYLTNDSDKNAAEMRRQNYAVGRLPSRTYRGGSISGGRVMTKRKAEPRPDSKTLVEVFAAEEGQQPLFKRTKPQDRVALGNGHTEPLVNEWLTERDQEVGVTKRTVLVEQAVMANGFLCGDCCAHRGDYGTCCLKDPGGFGERLVEVDVVEGEGMRWQRSAECIDAEKRAGRTTTRRPK